LELVQDINFSAVDGFWGVNDGGEWGVNDGGFWGGSFDLAEVECYSPGVARAWSVTLGNESADPFTVHSYTFNVDFRKD
jgi:hypothetical protein